MLSLLLFYRVYRLEIQSVMLVFSTQLCELLPLQLSPLTSPSSQSKVQFIQTVCGWEGMGRVSSCVGNHTPQEFNTLFLTRFRTYKIGFPSQTKT
jgi:hypothetical protein